MYSVKDIDGNKTTIFEKGDILEVEENGLVTRYEIVEDYGDKWHCKILDHYFQSYIGEYRTISKNVKIYKVEPK